MNANKLFSLKKICMLFITYYLCLILSNNPFFHLYFTVFCDENGVSASANAYWSSIDEAPWPRGAHTAEGDIGGHFNSICRNIYLQVL